MGSANAEMLPGVALRRANEALSGRPDRAIHRLAMKSGRKHLGARTWTGPVKAGNLRHPGARRLGERNFVSRFDLPHVVAAESKSLTATAFSSPFHNFASLPGTFSPTTSTLIAGRSEAVLVDAQHLSGDITALGDLIERSGRRLTTIVITHGHADHWYGLEALLNRFPAARAVATGAVVDWINENQGLMEQQWRLLFGDAVIPSGVVPQAIDDLRLDLEGNELCIVELGQGDISPSTALHVPGLELLVPGDVVYNGIHPMLGFTDPPGVAQWLESLQQIRGLAPKAIVAGHAAPQARHDEAARMLNQTTAYLEEFTNAAGRSSDAGELIETMTRMYPDFGNPWTLEFSAMTWFNTTPGGR